MTSQLIMYEVQGIPEPKPRMTHKDKFEPSPAVQRYWAWKKTVQTEINCATPGQFEPMVGPIHVTAYFRIPIPPSWTKQKRNDAELRLVLPTGAGTGDYDNYLKGIKDAMNKVVYEDDCQVIGVGEGYMYYSNEPGASVIVQEIEPPLILPWDTKAG